jgi:uncharacterized membrane protein YqhA
MFERILRVRAIYIIAVVFTLVSSAFFLVSGAVKSIHGYSEFITMWSGNEDVQTPGIHLAEGLDAFLLALVFLVFGLGIMKIFTHYDKKQDNLPDWLNISSFKELKVLLWETILVTLVVFSVHPSTLGGGPAWQPLVLPGVIFILSLSLYLMKKEEPHK